MNSAHWFVPHLEPNPEDRFSCAIILVAFFILAHDLTSRSDIMSCIKIDKPLGNIVLRRPASGAVKHDF